MKKLPKKLIFLISSIIISLIFVAICVTSIDYKSPTRDENKHLIRGIMLLETGDFRLNKHHPYFANVIDSIPLLFNEDLKLPSTNSENWENADKDAMGDELIEINGGKREFTQTILNPARHINIATTTILMLITGFFIFNEFGFWPATIFNVLFFFSPNLIAHTRLVTTDAMVVPLILLASICLYKYLKDNSRKWLITFIILGFISLLTKYSVIPIAFFWIGSIWINKLSQKGNLKEKLILTLKQSVIIIFSWILMLTAAYGFQFKTLVSTNYTNQHKIDAHLSNIAQLESTASFLVKPLQNLYLNVKLPFAEYLQGFLENVIFHDIYGHDSYLLGMYSNKGWWYYFPVAFGIKVPEPVIALTIITFIWGIISFIKTLKENNHYFNFLKSPKLVLYLIPISMFILSMKSSINLGLRHILIIFPFLYLAIATFITKIAQKNKTITIVISCILGFWYILETASIYPHYLEYFNSISGGPTNGHFYLLDSNNSWGQNDFLVEDYRLEMLNSDLTFLDPSENPEAGLIITDVDVLMGRNQDTRQNLEWLREPYINNKIKPIDQIANTHLVFDSQDPALNQ